MLKKVFSKPKKNTASSAEAIAALEKLSETLETLEKKDQLLQKRISDEVQKARDYANQKNKNAAIRCLKKKKLYEKQIEDNGNLKLQIHDKMLKFNVATATTATIDALREGSKAVKSIQQSLNVDDVSKTIEEASEQSENMKQMQDALANSIGVKDDFDEDELEAELEKLEELEEAKLEEQIPDQNSTVPTQPPSMTTTNLPKKETPKPVNDADDLADDLQAEMAL